MNFVTDKEELKPGLIIFRRGDVAHSNFYCRIKLPKEDRYKTVSLRTADRNTSRDQAFDYDADIRFRGEFRAPEAYESPRRTNPRSANGLWGFEEFRLGGGAV